jgi:uncharacterized protein (DUF169 family)
LTSGADVQRTLGLRSSPIAIAFLEEPPPGLAPWSGGGMPAGCAFWRKAMEGASFYTVPSDHYNCAVGAYTHGIDLPANRAHELGETLQFMDAAGYVAMDEVPGIPRRAQAPGCVAYAPVDRAPFRPDVVVIAAKPAQGMRIYEAALKAGAGEAVTRTLGRPGCAVLPLAIKSSSTTLSLGCIGNRTFTGLSDEELYLTIPGSTWPAVVDKLTAVQAANGTMQGHYQQQRERFAAD